MKITNSKTANFYPNNCYLNTLNNFCSTENFGINFDTPKFDGWHFSPKVCLPEYTEMNANNYTTKLHSSGNFATKYFAAN